MNFELFIALRYLKAKRKQAFISLISTISVVGVMVGVMALIVVLSVMNGFTEKLRATIMSVNTHVLISSTYGYYFDDYNAVMDKAKKVDEVVAVTPSLDSQVMVNETGAAIRGIDTKSAAQVMDIEPMIKEGRLSSLNELHDGKPGIIVGSELASALYLSVGDDLTVVSPQGTLTPMGRVPKSVTYRITGLFKSGMWEYDRLMTLISLKEAQDLLGIGEKVSGIDVKVVDPDRSDIVGGAINEALGSSFITTDWRYRNKSYFAAIKMEKIAMAIIMAMIVLVGSLNIISALVMVVMEKSGDIAILRAMGATKKNIMSIFMLQGLFVGVAGTLAGMLAGLGLCELIKIIPINLPADIYYLPSLPVTVNPMDVAMITLSAVLLSFLATIYPSWHASRLDPVEALRYE